MISTRKTGKTREFKNEVKHTSRDGSITIPHLLEYVQSVFLGKCHREIILVHDKGLFEFAEDIQKSMITLERHDRVILDRKEDLIIRKKDQDHGALHTSALTNDLAWSYIEKFKNYLSEVKDNLFLPHLPEMPDFCADDNLRKVLHITRNLAVIWDWALVWKNSFDQQLALRQTLLLPHDRDFQMPFTSPPDFMNWQKDNSDNKNYFNYVDSLLKWSKEFREQIPRVHKKLAVAFSQKPVFERNISDEYCRLSMQLETMQPPVLPKNIKERKLDLDEPPLIDPKKLFSDYKKKVASRKSTVWPLTHFDKDNKLVALAFTILYDNGIHVENKKDSTSAEHKSTVDTKVLFKYLLKNLTLRQMNQSIQLLKSLDKNTKNTFMQHVFSHQLIRIMNIKKSNDSHLIRDVYNAKEILKNIRSIILNTTWKTGVFGGKNHSSGKVLPSGLFKIINLIDTQLAKGEPALSILKLIRDAAQKAQPTKHTLFNHRDDLTQIFYELLATDVKIQKLSDVKVVSIKQLSSKKVMASG